MIPAVRGMESVENRFFLGDNLSAMRGIVNKCGPCVDMIYADPMFNSGANYCDDNGVVFTDKWKFDETEFAAVVKDHSLPVAIRNFLLGWKQAFGVSGDAGRELAYLCDIAPRVAEMRRVLKPTGSIYIHCDPSAVHALKKLMDAVFGAENFRSNIILKRSAGKNNTTRKFGRMHDQILFYVKSSKATFNPLYTPHDPKRLKTDKETGRPFVTVDLTMRCSPETKNPRKFKWSGRSPSAKRQWRFDEKDLNAMKKEGLICQSSPKTMPLQKLFVDDLKGVRIHDVWDDIKPLTARHREKVDSPTQKPVALVRRMILASSNPGDVVMDPFCGSGTTIAACHETCRRFIAMDISRSAMKMAAWRMKKQYPDFGELRVVRSMEAEPQGGPKSPQSNHGGDKTLTGDRKWKKAA